jgi:hypothetical protein
VNVTSPPSTAVEGLIESPSVLKATSPDNSALTGLEIANMGARKSRAHKICASGALSMGLGEQARHFKPASESTRRPPAMANVAGPIGKP